MRKVSLILLLIFLCINSSTATQNRTYKVGIIVYDGVYLLDFCGPLEIFNDAQINDSTKCFEVYLIAEKNELVKAHSGTYFKADFTIANSPEIDILVVPGGNLRLSKDNPDIRKYLLSASEDSEITMSVCTGAFILADLGLLNNKEATTWFGAKGRLAKLYPEIKLSDKRFTDNGKIITTAGVSAGIDGALHIVERLFGKEISDQTSKYIEWEK